RRTATAQLLAVMFVVGLVLELGFGFHVAGKSYFPLPWSKVGNLPALNSMLPVRYSMFVALGAAAAVALWSAGSAPRLARIALPALAVAAIVPSVWNTAWHEHPPRPAFFTARTYKTCLVPNENVLVLPYPRWSRAMLWQAESDFYFRLADGYISTVPTNLPDYDYADQLANTNRARPDWRPLVKLARDQEVTMILLAGEAQARWRTLLAPVTT